MRVSVIQNNPQDKLKDNLAEVVQLVRRAAAGGAELIALPEYYAFMGSDPVAHRDSGRWFAEIDGEMANLARELGVVVHAGSLVEARDDQTFNTTVVYGIDGQRLARYSKIHLFDVELPNGVVYKESDIISRGSDVVTYRVGDWTVGCTICYDIRFPTLYRRLVDQGCDLIMVPAAFTLATGKDHWEVLLRARAIETGCYVAAPAQIFSHAGGARTCYGHSLIADPWGHVVAKASDRVGIASTDIDLSFIRQVRAQLPVHRHHVLD
ncbi:MAG: carbon-nitrogen hydrolase family protein [Hydrogenophaga sp.]|nr:carbon-nitrogen hydrolase family protein [Hydrogenophaga sp.]